MWNRTTLYTMKPISCRISQHDSFSYYSPNISVLIIMRNSTLNAVKHTAKNVFCHTNTLIIAPIKTNRSKVAE